MAALSKKVRLWWRLPTRMRQGSGTAAPAASWGIISNIKRRAASSPREEEQEREQRGPKTHSALGTLLQTDARLCAGCSGGALINLRGEVIALTTSRAALTGLESAGGFAIPCDAAMKRIMGRLREGLEVEYGFLGISPRDGSPNPEGVRIEMVTPGGPAFLAGLQRDEVIKSVNGARLKEPEDLFREIGLLQAGGEARLEVQGRSAPVLVKLAKLNVPGKNLASNRPGPVRGIRVDYASVLYLQHLPTLVPELDRGIHAMKGVYVCEVASESPAATHLSVNEVITHVNGKEIATPSEFYDLAGRVPAGKPLTLTIANPDLQKPSFTTTVP